MLIAMTSCFSVAKTKIIRAKQAKQLCIHRFIEKMPFLLKSYNIDSIYSIRQLGF
jgi:hypothetical protein